jgi:DHA2 family methylenomycin A resistance protein-like MFS transporter
MPTATADPTAASPETGRTEAPQPADPSTALAAAVLGFFVVTLDAVVVNVALSSIRSDFGAGITGLQWVVDGYTLSLRRCCCGRAR